MSEISCDDVKKIARLARLKIEDKEIDQVQGKLNHVLNWVEVLDNANIDGVEPMTSVLPMTLKMRDDIVEAGGEPDKIVKNAPSAIEHFFAVPKVIE